MDLMWKDPKNGLPEKPGIRSYEHVECLVIRNGEILNRPWNCEHNCWDREDHDDYWADPLDVEYYLPLSEIRNLPKE